MDNQIKAALRGDKQAQADCTARSRRITKMTNNVVCFTDESITAQDAIKSLQMAIDGNETRTAIYNLAIQALQEKQERENPQALTLEELREMDGEPVWVESQSCKWWEIVYSEGDVLTTDTDHYLYLESYGIDWIAYRYPPKEATHAES